MHYSSIVNPKVAYTTRVWSSQTDREEWSVPADGVTRIIHRNNDFTITTERRGKLTQ